jgi:hypothetical protein
MRRELPQRRCDGLPESRSAASARLDVLHSTPRRSRKAVHAQHSIADLASPRGPRSKVTPPASRDPAADLNRQRRGDAARELRLPSADRESRRRGVRGRCTAAAFRRSRCARIIAATFSPARWTPASRNQCAILRHAAALSEKVRCDIPFERFLSLSCTARWR